MKKTLCISGLLISSVFISGCVATAIKSGVAEVETKTLNYPQPNTNIYAVKGSVMLLRAKYESGYRYRLNEDLALTLQYGNVSVKIDKGEELKPSIMDGKEYHCKDAASRTFLSITRNPVCLEIKDGKVLRMRYAPSAYYFTYEFDKPLSASREEIAVNVGSGVSKVEVLFEGANEETILLLMREYGENLTIPKSSKPIIFKKNANKIDELNVELEITSLKGDGVGYKVLKWN